MYAFDDQRGAIQKLSVTLKLVTNCQTEPDSLLLFSKFELNS